MVFDPNKHIIKLKGKDYLQVAWRLVWFREQCPAGTIETEMVHLDLESRIAIFKATVTDGKGGAASAYGSESAADFGDYLEKANTKAVGRALAMLGYGTQFTGDELNEMPRVVDAPVERTRSTATEATPSAAANGQAATQAVSVSPEIRERMNALYLLAIEKGKLPKKASAGDFLGLCAKALHVNQISAIEITMQHLDHAERYINAAAKMAEAS